MFLFSGVLNNFFHLFGAHDLVVGSESKSFMQRIGKISAGVGGNESIALDFNEVHIPQTGDHLASGEFTIQHFL